ncbi:uncharacterized protein LOC105390596 isoform X2 [Plutella xylostella]|uniref:uncharacterized protein LOC105390596 isoform X2 n=1 Tax=Plutella xylostella TaxID=51655 RepID=UPI002032967E|nr:uncharacterized protein LOC105390596 isoform X2 [Plutella xylostella]
MITAFKILGVAMMASSLLSPSTAQDANSRSISDESPESKETSFNYPQYIEPREQNTYPENFKSAETNKQSVDNQNGNDTKSSAQSNFVSTSQSKDISGGNAQSVTGSANQTETSTQNNTKAQSQVDQAQTAETNNQTKSQNNSQAVGQQSQAQATAQSQATANNQTIDQNSTTAQSNAQKSAIAQTTAQSETQNNPRDQAKTTSQSEATTNNQTNAQNPTSTQTNAQKSATTETTAQSESPNYTQAQTASQSEASTNNQTNSQNSATGKPNDQSNGQNLATTKPNDQTNGQIPATGKPNDQNPATNQTNAQSETFNSNENKTQEAETEQKRKEVVLEIYQNQSEENNSSAGGNASASAAESAASEQEASPEISNENKEEVKQPQPNIVIIMADDLGWNDVSFHGSNQILTPNIDAIMYTGVSLQQYYTDAWGSAARTAFLTGKYPMRLGMQGPSIMAHEDRGLPSEETTLPQRLQQLGYSTHLVGKWGLGKSRPAYLPTNRGYDSFFGFLDDSIDYYTFDHIENYNNSQLFGLDLYNDITPAPEPQGHLTDVLTDHAVQLIRSHDIARPLFLQVSHAAPHAGGGMVSLQPPPGAVAWNHHVAHSTRRLYAGMVTSLDRSIGDIVAALADSKMLQNTIIAFVSDNGAAPVGKTQNYGTNLPLRGLKGTPFDGAVRSAAVLWHPELEADSWEGLFHVTDWVPTLVAAAGGNVTAEIDGVNQWDAIRKGEVSARNDMLISIDDLNGWAAIREGDYKLVIGTVDPSLSDYYGESLMGVRFKSPSYEGTLLDCETAKVIKESLAKDIDINVAIIRRNESTLSPAGQINITDLCIPNNEKGCLFNIIEDPHEAHDLWAQLPELVKRLTLRLRALWSDMRGRHPARPDARADPALHQHAWAPWLEDSEPAPLHTPQPPEFPLRVTKAELQYLVDINLDAFKTKIYESINSMGNSFVKSVGSLFSFK